MITAVDTNILLDVLIRSAPHRDESEQALKESMAAGATVISEAVYAELASRFDTEQELDRFLRDTGIRSEPSSAEALFLAGRAWVEYLHRRPSFLTCSSCGASQDMQCPSCGTEIRPRQHVVADFLIGAHATIHADRMLTRDRRIYRTYFARLQLA